MASSLQIPVTAVGLEQSIQDAIKKAGTNAHLNFGQGSSHISSLSQPLGKLTGQADQFASSMKAANARVLAFGASVGIINAVSNAFKTMLQDAIGVEKSLADINSVLGESSSALEKFGNTLFDVAKNTGQSFKTVAEGALELARQGLGTEETLKRINDALVLSRLSGLDAAASVEGLTAAYNSFKETGISTHEIVNKLVAVSQKYAVSERDLIEGLKRSSSVADQAGVSLDELIGVITAVQERTARGGAVIGNSFKTIFSKIQDKAVLQDLNDIGVEVMDMQGKILPATKVLQNLSKVMSTLSQTEQMDIEKKLGGVYQLSNLLAALKDMSSEQSKYTESVKVSQNASNEAFQKNAALNETFAALLNRVSLSAEQLGSTLAKLGVTDNLKGLIGFFNGIMESIQKILGQDDTLGTMFKGLAKGIGALFSGPGLMLFGAIILKLSKDLAQFGFNSLKGFFGVGQAAKEIKSIEESVAAALMTNVSLQQKLFALEGNRAAQLKVISDQIIIQEAGLRNITSISKGMSVGLYSAGVRTSEQGLRIPAKADGFLPAIAQESSSIQRGVGGARSGDRPVVIPNFSFGGGMTGPMVAHTGEVMVPNFANGGSAIFNRNMVASMGMPAGAQRIGAARGFIPNFAKDIVIDARALGGLGAASISKENKGDFANTSTKFTSLGQSEQAILMSIFGGDSKGLNNSNVSMTNIETRELKNFGGSDRQKSFRQAVNRRIGPSLVDLSRDLFGNGIFSSKHESGLKAGFQNEKNDPHIFSDGVLGGLFESAVMTATKSIEKMGEFQAGNNPAFDFESDGSPDRKFQNAFGFGNIIKADAKKTGDHDPYRTFIGKALRDLDVRRKIIEVYAPQKNEEGVKEALSLGVKTGRTKLTLEEQKPSKEFPMGRLPRGWARTRYSSDFEGMYNFSSGYIPNFANYIYDSDQLTPEQRKTILPQILGSSITKDVILAPSGAGKTTLAAKMGAFIRNIDDLKKATRFTLLSGAGMAKSGGMSSGLQEIVDSVKKTGGKLSFLNVSDEEIKKRREGRSPVAGDLRSEAALKGTQYAPVNQPEFIEQIKKQLGSQFQIINGAGGFIPNFASPIQEAISREASSGVSPSQIYIDRNPSLVNSGNPMGMMVANRRDEPSGGSQGISRAIREGRNPQTYGAANGFVPNYADPLTMGIGPTGVGVKQSKPISDNLDELNKLIEDLNKDIAANIKTYEEAKKAVDGFVQGIKGKTTEQTKVKVADAAKKQLTAPEPEAPKKGSRDMLGTIFALQAGLSMLSGATEGATSSFAKYTNVVSDGLSKATSIGFVFQGFKSMAAEGGKLAGVLGTVGIAAGVLVGAWQIGKGVYDEVYGGNIRAAKSTALLAEAATKASLRLDELKPIAKQQMEKQAKDLQFNIEHGNLDLTTGKYKLNERLIMRGLGGGARLGEDEKKTISIGGTEEEKKAYSEALSSANTAGRSFAEITKIIDSFAVQKSWGQEGRKLEEGNLSSAISKISELSYNPKMDTFKSDLKKASIGEIGSAAGINEQRLKIQSGNLNAKEQQGLLKDLGVGQNPGETSWGLILAQVLEENKQKIVQLKADISSVLLNVKKISNEMIIQQRIEEVSLKNISSKNNEEIKHLGIVNNINSLLLTDTSKTKLIDEENLRFQKQKVILDSIKAITEQISSIPQKVFADPSFAMTGITDVGRQKNVAKLLEERFSKIDPNKIGSEPDLKTAAADLTKGMFSKDQSEMEKALQSILIKQIQEIVNLKRKVSGETKESNRLLDDTFQKEQKLKDLEKDRLNQFEKIAQYSNIKSGLSSNQGIINQGNISLTDVQKEIKMTKLERFGNVSDPKEMLAKQREIEDEFFNKKLKLQEEESRRQLNSDIQKELLTKENITALLENNDSTKQNTEALKITPVKIVDAFKNLFISAGAMFGLGGKEGNSNIVSANETGISNTGFSFLQKLMTSEVGSQGEDAQQALLETIRNRSVKQGRSFEATMSDMPYWGERDQIKNKTPMDASLLRSLLAKVNSGSNIANGATDNASGSVAENARKRYGAKAEYGGELFYSNTDSKPGVYKNPLDTQKTIDLMSTYNSQIEEATQALSKETDAATLTAKIREAAQAMGAKTIEAENALVNILTKKLVGEGAISATSSVARAGRSASKNLEDVKNQDLTFYGGLARGMSDMRTEINSFANTLGKDIPKMFSNGMSNAIMQAIEGGKSLGGILQSAAYDFVKTLNQKMIGNLMDKTISGIGSMMPSFISNIFTAKASGGPITGGSGTKDDIPAVLMGGEYVINKNSVSKYGQGFLSAVNNGTLKAFADGGLAQNGPQGNYFIPGQYGMGDITGRSNLLNFATQTATGGSHDSAINDRNYSSVSLEAESSSLTSFGRRTGPMADALRLAKEQAFGLYIQDYQAEQARKEAEKQQSKALKNQLMMMGITIAGGAIISAGAKGFGNAYSSATGGVGSKTLAGMQGIWSGGGIGSLDGSTGGGLKNLFSGNFDAAFQGQLSKTKRATGGSIPNSSGIDTIPSMLSGGEFVMNRSAAQNIGSGNLQALNSGASSLPTEDQAQELNDKIVAKLDELIKSSSGGGAITINVDSSTGKSTEQKDNDTTDTRNQLASQIKQAVLKVIQDEKRLGGSLRI